MNRFERHPIGWVYSQNYFTSSILAFIDITRHSTGLILVYDYLSLVDLSASRCHYISLIQPQPAYVVDYLSFPLAITRPRAIRHICDLTYSDH